MKSIYLNQFENEESMLKEFGIDKSVLDGYKVLLASYGKEYYDGYAFVLLKRKQTKELVTVYASHCSCYGLEGQFELEESSLELLNKLYAEDHYYAFRECRKELGEILIRLSKKK